MTKAHYNLAAALRLSEDIQKAIYHARQVLRMNPGHAKVLPLLFRLAQHACDWELAAATSRRLEALTAQELDRGLKTTEPPLTSIRRSMDAQANLKVARSWSRHLSAMIQRHQPAAAFKHQTTISERLRIGYVSSDFKDHAVAYQIRGLLASHDRSKFTVHGYACNPDDRTPYRRRMAEACDCFVDVHQRTNVDIARRIRDDGIQVLIDMAGHSRNNRLGIAALRPAPVQVSYLGFLASTGADFMDYVLADPIVVPEDHAWHYTEKVVYLPHCYQANDDGMPEGRPIQQRRDWHLPLKAMVFCSFNQPYKIDAALFATWMRILHRVPNSVLWLVERSALARQNLCRVAAEAGIDPSRLIFTGFVPMELNLARLKLADLVLDTRIYNGGATTSNALWAGVPVLTVLGRHWVSRMSASALHAVGLPELIARDLQTYEDMAVALAHDPQRLRELWHRLEEQRHTSPLFNTARFTRHVEKAFTQMWIRHCQGLPPASFHVAL